MADRRTYDLSAFYLDKCGRSYDPSQQWTSFFGLQEQDDAMRRITVPVGPPFSFCDRCLFMSYDLKTHTCISDEQEPRNSAKKRARSLIEESEVDTVEIVCEVDDSM